MKKSALLLLLAVVTVTLGVVCWRQSQRLAQHRSEMLGLQSELRGQAQQLTEVKAVKEHLNQQRSELLHEVNQQWTALSRQSTASVATAESA